MDSTNQAPTTPWTSSTEPAGLAHTEPAGLAHTEPAGLAYTERYLGGFRPAPLLIEGRP